MLMLVAILMTAIPVMGLLSRERRGIANIGLKSFLLIAFYLAASLYSSWDEAALRSHFRESIFPYC